MKPHRMFPMDLSRASVVGYFFILASVFLQSASLLCSKQAGLTGHGHGLLTLVVNPWYFCSLCCLGLQALCWIFVLRRLPLSFAYPFMSLVLPLNLFWAWLLFREQVCAHHFVGTAIILLGVVLVAREGACNR
jgi:drug/metabolite transporter (DMT)-like permease